MDSLYEMTGAYMQVMEMMSDPECDEEVIKDTLDAIGGEIEAKADNYFKLIKNLERLSSIATADADTFKKEYERRKAKADAFDNRVAGLKKRLTDAMVITGKTKFKTDNASYWVQANASLKYDDMSQIPEEYLIPQPAKVDSKKLTAYLKELAKSEDEATRTVPWARLEYNDGVRFR